MSEMDTGSCVLRARGLRKEYGREAGWSARWTGSTWRSPRARRWR